jgi:hypothetical protein
MESRLTRPTIIAWPTTSGADLLGGRNERRRSDLRERGAVPARKRFEAADPACRQGDDRLEDNADLRFGDCSAHGVLGRAAAGGVGFRRRVEDGYAAAPARWLSACFCFDRFCGEARLSDDCRV